jgi:RimJ/RimL family protein N-acetyltransferase
MIYGKIVEKFNLEGKEVIFRYPKLEDVDGLLRLINSLVEERAMLDIQEKKTRKEEEQWLSDQLKKIKEKKAIYLVITVNGKIMGGADIQKGPVTREHVGVLGIFLRKEIRAKGIGRRLMRRLIEESKKILKIKTIRLTTMSINKAAQRFFKKLGFKEIGRIKKGRKYYGRYVDDVIMVKYL